MSQVTLAYPGRIIVLVMGKDGRYTSGYCEWNGKWHGCHGHDHLTRADALSCAEDRLRYRA
jgi:hypothetical protein